MDMDNYSKDDKGKKGIMAFKIGNITQIKLN